MSDDWLELYCLLGRANGVLEAQPLGPKRRPGTLAAYRRYAERGLEGFASWNVSPEQARTFVRSATRAVTLERLAVAGDVFEAALSSRDHARAVQAAAEVKELLHRLSEVRAARPGRRSLVPVEGTRDSTDHPSGRRPEGGDRGSDRRPRAEVRS